MPAVVFGVVWMMSGLVMLRFTAEGQSGQSAPPADEENITYFQLPDPHWQGDLIFRNPSGRPSGFFVDFYSDEGAKIGSLNDVVPPKSDLTLTSTTWPWHARLIRLRAPKNVMGQLAIRDPGGRVVHLPRMTPRVDGPVTIRTRPLVLDDGHVLISNVGENPSAVRVMVVTTGRAEHEVMTLDLTPFETKLLGLASVVPDTLRRDIVGVKFYFSGSLVVSTFYQGPGLGLIHVEAGSSGEPSPEAESDQSNRARVAMSAGWEQRLAQEEAVPNYANARGLRVPWTRGQYWVPQTYDYHIQGGNAWSNGARFAADFYWATPQASGVYNVSLQDGRGKPILAAHDGVADVYRYPWNGGCGGLVEDSSEIRVSDSANSVRTWYVHGEPGDGIRQGDSVVVNNKGIGRYLRTCPSTGCDAVLAPDGTKLTVLSGSPTRAEGYDWYQVRGYVGGALRSGWMAKNSGAYEYSGRSVLVNGLFHVGSQVLVTASPYLNLRDAPSRGGNRLAVLYPGTELAVLAPPSPYQSWAGAVQDPEGYTWWYVGYGSQYGWVADADPPNAGGYPLLGIRVRAGDLLGTVSDQGCAENPHLHFQVQDMTVGGWMPLDSNSGSPQVFLDNEVIFQPSPCPIWDSDSTHGTIYRCSSMPRGTSTGYSLTVNKNAAAGGTVTSSPSGINCGTSCSASFSAGTQVTLTASPAPGWQFSSWSGCDSASGNTCIVNMTGNRTVTANFTQPPILYTLTVNKNAAAGGTVTSDPPGINCGTNCGTQSANFAAGIPVTLTASPAPGWQFSSWSGCDSASGNTCIVNMTGNRTVTANFTQTSGPPANDEPSGATVIGTLPFRTTQDTTMATTSAVDPVHSCSTGGRDSNTVWFRWVATFTGRLRVDTFGSNYDTVLAAYTGSTSPGQELACNDDTGGTFQSRIEFAVTSGQSYLIQVSDWSGPGGGTLVLNVRGVVPGDFNGDGRQDLIWQNDTWRSVTVHYYQGANFVGWAWLNTAGASGWRVVGAADFDGNGTPDLVWQNDSTQQLVVHYYDSTNFTGWSWLNASNNPGWRVVAVADFNRDGWPDVVWQNDTWRSVTVHYYQRANFVGWAWLNVSGAAGWRIVGAADFDGNGTPDLVWQNDSTRQVTVHYYAGSNLTGWSWLNASGVAGWAVAGVGDFNGDGKPDLVWQNDSTRQVTVHYYGGGSGNQFLGWAWLNAGGVPGWRSVVPR